MVSQIQADAGKAYNDALAYMSASQDKGLQIVADYVRKDGNAPIDGLAGEIANIHNDAYNELLKMLKTLSVIGERGLTLAPEDEADVKSIRQRDVTRLLHYASGIRGNIEPVMPIDEFVRAHKQDLAFSSRSRGSLSV